MPMPVGSQRGAVREVARADTHSGQAVSKETLADWLFILVYLGREQGQHVVSADPVKIGHSGFVGRDADCEVVQERPNLAVEVRKEEKKRNR